MIVWKTARAVIGELISYIGRWLTVAWLPWLLGTVVYITLGQLYWRNIQTDLPPQWLLSLALAPFSAMIFVRILKNILLQVPVHARKLDLSRQMWLTALVVAVISLMFSGVDWLRCQFFEHQATTTDLENIYLIGAVGWSASWTVKAIIMAASYGMFAIIVEQNRIDVVAAITLVRRHFIKFFGLVLVLGLIYLGFEELYAVLVRTFDLTPQGSALAPILSEATTFLFLNSLLWSPVNLLADILPAVAVGVVCRALREYQLTPGKPSQTAQDKGEVGDN